MINQFRESVILSILLKNTSYLKKKEKEKKGKETEMKKHNTMQGIILLINQKQNKTKKNQSKNCLPAG